MTWLLIDFDNTMMATEQYALPSLIERFNALYGGAISHPLTIEEFKTHFHGQAREVLCENLSRHFGISVDCPLLYESREWRMMQHLQSVPGGIPMAPGIIQALAALAKDGWEFAFVSNNPIQRAMAAMRFAANGRGADLARLFGCNFFEAGDVQKPKPDIYLRAMEQLATRPEDCVAVEDSVSGAAAAIGAGILTFGFTGFADRGAGEKLLAAGCAATFPDWRDFPALLENEDRYSP
jgi:HAD superfamily hydrolase (TIGR01509 family)